MNYVNNIQTCPKIHAMKTGYRGGRPILEQGASSGDRNGVCKPQSWKVKLQLVVHKSTLCTSHVNIFMFLKLFITKSFFYILK